MNKSRGLKLSFILLLINILLPLKVFGIDTNTLEGPDLTSPSQSITYDIKVNAEQTIEEYNATLTYETAILEFVGIENKGNWKGNNTVSNESGPVDLKFTHENGVSGETVIATLKFKVKKDVTKADTFLTIKGTTVTQEEKTINNVDLITKTVTIKSTDNTLSDLKLNGKTVVNFSPSTCSYSIQVQAETTTASIDAFLNSKTATFVENYGSRSIPLNYGENVIEIKVNSASLDEKTYVLNINRLDNRGTNNDLKSLILNSGTIKINFDKDVLEYNVKTHKLTTIDIEAVAEDSKAKVNIDKPEALIYGENPVKITVTSEDGKEKVYKIKINNVNYDIDTSLKNIELFGSNQELNFDPKILDYEIRYDAKYKDSLVIKPVLNTVDEDVQIDEPLFEKTSSNLKSGSIVEIRVYATNGVESIYTITFIEDDRINFFFLLGLSIFIVLLIIFIKMFVSNRKSKKKNIKVQEKQTDLEKTKRMKKINLE